MTTKDLFNMKLHEVEVILIENMVTTILRVPGGLIYTNKLAGSAVFVPLSEK